jgi:hypothetical protein
VNPDHLFLGSHADNTADMVSKGRHRPHVAPGAKNPASKLTESSAIAIIAALRSGARQVDIARRFGVTKGAIGWIARGKTWRHIHR